MQFLGCIHIRRFKHEVGSELGFGLNYLRTGIRAGAGKMGLALLPWYPRRFYMAQFPCDTAPLCTLPLSLWPQPSENDTALY